MGKMKRFVLILYALIGLVSVGILAALWFAWAPVAGFVNQVASMQWFAIVELVLLGITSVGFVGVLIHALTARSKHSQLTAPMEDGSVAITQNALQSTVRHVIESHHGLEARAIKVSVLGSSNPRLVVHAKVDPGKNANLSSMGAMLQREIAASVTAFSGYPVESADIVFVGDAEGVTPAFTRQATQNRSSLDETSIAHPA